MPALVVLNVMRPEALLYLLCIRQFSFSLNVVNTWIKKQQDDQLYAYYI
jgi:hypothetical protein